MLPREAAKEVATQLPRLELPPSFKLKDISDRVLFNIAIMTDESRGSLDALRR